MAVLEVVSVWMALGVVGAVGVLLTLARAFTSPIRHLPGPFYSRFTRLPLKTATFTGRRMYFIDALHHRYGPVVRIAPGEIAVSDPEAFAAIHRIGSGFHKSAFYDAMPYGLFAMRDPKIHAQRRKLFARAFSLNALRSNWEGIVRAKVERAVKRIFIEGKERGEVEVMKWWTLMANDVIAHLSFGESFDMLEIGEKTEYIRVLETALISTSIRIEFPLLHYLVSKLPIPSILAIMNGNKYLYDFGSRAVTNLRNQRGNTSNLFGTMLATLEGESSQEKQKMIEPLTDHHIQLEAGNLVVAGSDTTAVTTTFLVWCVLKRPDLQRRLEEEVATLPEQFDDAAVEKLPLLGAVINEALRLYGAAPGGLPRAVPKGGTTLAGHFIPEDYVVETQAYTLHRNPDVFPNPLEFDETRFLGPEKRSKSEKLLNSPFGAGSRVCLGLHLARMELRLATAIFFRKCRGARLSMSMNDEMMEMENYFLVAPKGHMCNVVLP